MKNFVFSKPYNQMDHLSTIVMSKVSENLLNTLYLLCLFTRGRWVVQKGFWLHKYWMPPKGKQWLDTHFPLSWKASKQTSLKCTKTLKPTTSNPFSIIFGNFQAITLIPSPMTIVMLSPRASFIWVIALDVERLTSSALLEFGFFW